MKKLTALLIATTILAPIVSVFVSYKIDMDTYYENKLVVFYEKRQSINSIELVLLDYTVAESGRLLGMSAKDGRPVLITMSVVDSLSEVACDSIYGDVEDSIEHYDSLVSKNVSNKLKGIYKE